MFKDVYKSANKKIPLNPALLEKAKNNSNHRNTNDSSKYSFFKNHKLIAIPVLSLIILCIIFARTTIYREPNVLNKNNQTANPTINNKNSIFGVLMYNSYRYNGSYYDLKNTDPNIQKNISNHLYGGFYAIKNIPTSKSIAMFANGYYYRLDYTHKDTVFFNNMPYLITGSTYIPNRPGNNTPPGKFLGKANEYDIYEVSNSDTTKEIYVKIDNEYLKAYQYLSYVKLNGINYELKTEKNPITKDSAEEYIGMAGPYKAYRYNNNDIIKSIVVHINDSEEVIADATTLSDKEPLPVSRYGSDEESMYPIGGPIQWRMHGIYLEASSHVSKEQVGKKLETITIDNYSFELYEMKGEDTTKSIIVKNNKVYLKYNFMFTDIIKFNGHDYIIGYNDPNRIIGEQIGTFGTNKIHEIKGVDPSKMIDVFMSSTSDDTGLRANFTAYRQDD
jgi:hypothetical protein